MEPCFTQTHTHSIKQMREIDINIESENNRTDNKVCHTGVYDVVAKEAPIHL